MERSKSFCKLSAIPNTTNNSCYYMKKENISRRQFLGTTVLAVAGLAAAAEPAFGIPAYIKNLGKPNSLINGVQIGVISYSWRSLPSRAEQILQYCIDCNISAIELMGPAAETFAGAPEAPPRPAGGGGQRQPL